MSSHKTSSHGRRKPLSGVPSAREVGEMERLRQNEVAMKARIRALELEVETLKYRLDSLRKAKSTTIVRREREEVHISSPKLGRQRASTHSLPSTSSHQDTRSDPSPPSCPHGDLLKEIERLSTQVDSVNSHLLSERAVCERQLEELREREGERGRWEKERERLREELRQLKEAKPEPVVQCEVSEELRAELERLRRENSELVGKLEEMISTNEELRESNLLLQGRCEALLEDLSVKEARWSEREERLQAEIRKQWGERYHEWITKAEKKMVELQQLNTMLQQMLRSKEHNPDL